MHQERRTMRRRKTKVSKKFALLMAAMPRGQQQPFVLVGQSFSHEMVSLLFHFMMAFCKKKKLSPIASRQVCLPRKRAGGVAAQCSKITKKNLVLTKIRNVDCL